MSLKYKILTKPTEVLRLVIVNPYRAFLFTVASLVSKGIHYIPETSYKNKIRSLAFSRFTGSFPVPRAGLINKGDTVVSVGAASATQVHTLVHHVGSRGKVLVIEPSPVNQEFLEPAVNQYDNVFFDRRGAWREPDSMIMKLAPEENPDDHKIQINNIEHDNDYKYNQYDKKVEIQVAPLDSIINDYNISPDYVEVMVNGAELEVLKGSSQMLETSAPRLWIKGHARDQTTGEPINIQIVKLLEQYNYNTVLTNGGAPTVGETDEWTQRDGDVYGFF